MFRRFASGENIKCYESSRANPDFRKEEMGDSKSSTYDLEEGTELQVDFSKIATAAEQCPP